MSTISKTYEKDGVKLYLKKKAPGNITECVDIDISPEVTTLQFGPPDLKQIRYSLRGVMKCYPNVKEIKISYYVEELDFSNFMFPNVRTVRSDNTYFSSGSCLIRSERWKTTLLNTFCLREDETLNLDYAYGLTIGEYALEGCRSEHIAWPRSGTDDDLSIVTSRLSFQGCKIRLEPMVNGIATIEDALVAYDWDSDEVIIPPEVEHVVACGSPFKTDRLSVSKASQLYGVPEDSEINILDINDNSVIPESILIPKSIKEFQVNADNPYYCADQGVLYTKNMDRLVLFPSGRDGHFTVPEGVVRIQNRAFIDSSLNSISLATSVRSIGANAFRNSALSRVDLGDGLAVIGMAAFQDCNSLRKIDIPSNVVTIGTDTFMGCENLEDVVLHDGLQIIGRDSFCRCFNLKSLSVPRTVNEFGCENAAWMKEITFEGEVLPDEFGWSFFTIGYDKNAETCPIITIKDGKGHSVQVPAVISKEGSPIVRSLRFVSQLFDPAFVRQIPCLFENDVLRQDFTIMRWDKLSADEKQTYETKFKKNGARICSRLIDQGKEELLVKFVGTGLLSTATLNNLLSKIPEEMTQVNAVVLNALGAEKKKKSFHL